MSERRHTYYRDSKKYLGRVHATYPRYFHSSLHLGNLPNSSRILSLLRVFSVQCSVSVGKSKMALEIRDPADAPPLVMYIMVVASNYSKSLQGSPVVSRQQSYTTYVAKSLWWTKFWFHSASPEKGDSENIWRSWSVVSNRPVLH